MTNGLLKEISLKSRKKNCGKLDYVILMVITYLTFDFMYIIYPTCISNKIFFRWHDEKVSSLQLAAPLSILPHLSVEQAITIMNEEGYDQLPVIDEMGWVERKTILISIALSYIILLKSKIVAYRKSDSILEKLRVSQLSEA